MNRRLTREFTCRLLDSVDEGLLDKDQVINACLSYLSEDQVRDMCEINQFFDDSVLEE